MKKSINITKTENGNKYFEIYEVRARKHDGEVIIYNRYLDEKEANDTADFVARTLHDLYEITWTRSHIVWC